MSADLLRRLEAFDPDGPDVPALPFAARLAREHGWTAAFAARVVREYKRFLYLAATAGEPVCPSEQVDACWHLHLTYTRSYWHRLCGEVLGRPVHHDPTRGGPGERDKHGDMYDHTLRLYREAFGHMPPADVWPPAAERFGPDARNRVVNVARNWVLPKASVRRAAVGSAAAVVVVLALAGCGGGFNPFALKGAQFLGFLVPVMVGALALGLAVRSMRKGPGLAAGEEPPAVGWAEAAFLAGGNDRLTSAVVARLVHSGAAEVVGDTVTPNRHPPVAPSPVEEAALAELPVKGTAPGARKRLTAAVSAAFRPDADRLRDAGFVFSPDAGLGTAVMSAVPLVAVLLGFGLPRLVAGLHDHKPVWFLVAALVVGAVAAVKLLAAMPHRTRKGDQLLAALSTRHRELKSGKAWQAADDAPLAVALFGTAVLFGSPLTMLHSWYPKAPDAGGTGWTSGGDNGDSGGGSGCGSGCGGCGGGGD